MNKIGGALVVLTVAVAAVAWVLLSGQPTQPEKNNTAATDTSPASPPPSTLVRSRPNEVSENGYVGSQSCQECHEDFYRSWHDSYHRTMTQVISPASAPDVIENASVTVEGLTYRFRRDGDNHYVELNDPTSGGMRRQRQLLMMTGSHHMHVFWYQSEIEGTPAQLPIIYLRDQQRWIPRRSAFLRPPDETPGENEMGRWNSTCSRCHSTHPRLRPNTDARTWETRVVEFGIACEACHGPGQDHIQFHRNEENVGADPIVNPLDLPAASRSDLCGQCHSISMYDFSKTSKENFSQHGSPFRPGQVLDEDHFHQIIRAIPEFQQTTLFARWNTAPDMMRSHFWPDGEVRISGRDYNGMIESACYQQGDLSCMSCHTMHQQDAQLRPAWKDDQLKPEMRGDAACLQCHAEYRDLASAHTHHLPQSSGSRCMNCHMPATVYGLLKTIRSHRISSPSVASALRTGRPTACNLCHLDHTLQQTSNHLADWFGHRKPKLTNLQSSVAASVLSLLQGDAGQRAVQIAAFESSDAHQASGTAWLRPYLLIGMDDPYEAIRLIAQRVYASLFGAPLAGYDFLALPMDRHHRINQELDKVKQETKLPANPALLIDENGVLNSQRIDELMQNRDQRDVFLLE